MAENYFGERFARDDDRLWPDVCDPGVVEPIVNFLAE
jgi:hypothetical protein